MQVERMEGESQRAFECFLVYLSLPTASIKRAYKIYTNGGNSRYQYKWARKFRWEERRTAYMMQKLLGGD